MSYKSDSELKEILNNQDKYTNEALQAVYWELEKRGLQEEVTIDEQLLETINSPVIEEKVVENQAENVDENSSPFDTFEKKKLYSKAAILGFSVFFSTIFGAVLLMYNMRVTQNYKARIQVLLFGLLYMVLLYTVVFFITPNFLVTLGLNYLGYTIMSEYFWNKYIGKNYDYEKKQIGKPLLISICIVVFIVLLQFLPVILGVEV